jgi:diguanylate cyclase (GGDEF)-like protein/PAS domain S-box-containing protein/putative nucleotidyltransferase with HDIG domain
MPEARSAGEHPHLPRSSHLGTAADDVRDQLQPLYDACPDAVVIIKADGVIIFANVAVATIFGWDPAEIAGKELAVLQPERLRAAHREGLRRYLASGERKLDWRATRIVGLHRDGHEFPVEVAFTDLGGGRFGGFIRDISGRVAAEEALHASDRRYRELVDDATDMVYAHDLQGNFTYVNAAAARVYGYSIEELLGLSIAAIVDPEHLGRVRNSIAVRIQQGGTTTPYELLTRTKTGAPVWLEVSTRIVCDEAGAPAAIHGIARDVSARKQAEDALARTRDFRDRVMESTTNAIAASDLQGRFTLANHRMCEMTGYGIDELLGEPVGKLLVVAPRELVQGQFAAAARGGEVDDIELELVRKDRSVVFIRSSMRPLMEDGVVVGVVVLAEDITERKRAGEALRESRERYRQMFESTSAVRLLVDPATRRIVEPNEAACAYYGYSREELTGMDTATINTRSPEEISALMAEAMASGRTFFEVEHRLSSGELRDVEIYTGPVDIGGKHYLISTVFDVTERKRAGARLNAQTRLLEEKSALLEAALASERERSCRDTLTGTLNHAAIADEARSLTEQPGAGPLALAMVDVDGLKAVNDIYGHQMGDAVLLAVAEALQRDGAIVGRYGGDEFIAILPDCDREAAAAYRQQVTDALAAVDLHDGDTGSRIQIVASIGLAIYPEEADAVEGLIKLSDSAMYTARRQRAETTASTAFARVQGGDRAAEIVGEIVPFLTSPGDLDEKLRLVAARLSSGAGYDAVNFSLYGANFGVPSRSASFSESRVAAEQYDVESKPHDEPGPMRIVLESTRRPIVIDDLQDTEFTTPVQKELFRTVGLCSGLVAPMVWRGEVIGMVSVGSKQPAAFGPRDAQFLSAIATQVTAIVRTAALVDDLQSASDRLLQAHTETVVMLAAAAEAHDDTTGRHLQRVREIAQALAAELGHDEEAAKEIGLAAVLHDIGKIRVPDYVLVSSASLSDSEWTLMKEHTVWGSEFLASRGGFELAMHVARSHHERWDGSGYPDGLLGDQIPEAAAITSVADSLDAMINNRPYRAGRPLADAVLEIQAWSGRQFSPRVVDALVALHERGELAHLAAGGEHDQLAA